jgi:hypothetical protein
MDYLKRAGKGDDVGTGDSLNWADALTAICCGRPEFTVECRRLSGIIIELKKRVAEAEAARDQARTASNRDLEAKCAAEEKLVVAQGLLKMRDEHRKQFGSFESFQVRLVCQGFVGGSADAHPEICDRCHRPWTDLVHEQERIKQENVDLRKRLQKISDEIAAVVNYMGR